MKRTKDELFRIAKEAYGFDEKTVLVKIKDAKCKIPFDQNEWHCYIQAISAGQEKLARRDPCIYCGNPIVLFRDGWRCVYSPVTHTNMKRIENMLQEKGMESLEIRKLMMRKCKHGLLRFDCNECIEDQVQKNFEENK